MGGFGALKVAMKYPEMFGSVSTHSAALVPDFATASPIVKTYMGLAEAIFGIGLSESKPDFSYWDANNPLELAKATNRLQGLKIYFDCGADDMFGFFEGHKVLDDLLTKANYTHTAALHPGPHGWTFARQHMRTSLLFHWKAFDAK
jgi:S-formylglutathione hydrolase FrmB